MKFFILIVSLFLIIGSFVFLIERDEIKKTELEEINEQSFIQIDEIQLLRAQIIEKEAKISEISLSKEALERGISKELMEKQERIVRLEKEIGEGREKIKELEKQIKELPIRLEEKLRNPTWAELKDFLRKDKTNEIVFDDKTFDCSGFAITLFQNARAYGIRTAYVEVVFVDYGHALNKFKTTDEGYIFIDVTGNREGTGRDTVAYIQKGKFFGTINIDAVVREKIDCGRINHCQDFINPLPTKRHRNLFDYSFFEEDLVCGDLYDRCFTKLNTEIGRFNRRESDLTRNQLNSWIDNNKKLFNQITVDNKLVFIETKNRVTNVEIYW